MFINLFKLAKGLFCLPHSSAAAERQFSNYNLLKTKIRNHLTVDTYNSILHMKDILERERCYSWTPNKSPYENEN